MEAGVATPTEQQEEQDVIKTQFGTITNKRVVYFRNKGWFSGGSREDIPLKHVTSVRLEVSRSLAGGIFLLLVGLALLSGNNSVKAVGAVVIAIAVLVLWGSPTVVVNTAGNDRTVSKGFPWLRREASAFVDVLRKQLFHE